MSNRILNHVSVSQAPAIVSEPIHVMDDATRAVILAEAEQAYERGVTDGRRAALEAARAEATAVADAVTRASAALQQTVAAQHAALADALAKRVMDTTRAVIGREPTDEGLTLIKRLHGAIGRTDEVELTVRVAANRQAVAAEALAGRAGVTYEVDDTLGPDDAMITGAFARLDLRTTTLLDAMEELLLSQPGIGPLADNDNDDDTESDGQHEQAAGDANAMFGELA